MKSDSAKLITAPMGMNWRLAVAGIAFLLFPGKQLLSQATPSPRRTVPVTLVQTRFADSPTGAVIMPQASGQVMILLPVDATPQLLLTAIAVLDSKRLPLVRTNAALKAIVINGAVTSRLSGDLEARLSARLDQLAGAPVRSLKGFGQVRALTFQVSLAPAAPTAP